MCFKIIEIAPNTVSTHNLHKEDKLWSPLPDSNASLDLVLSHTLYKRNQLSVVYFCVCVPCIF